MISDKETNTIYFSELLKTDSPLPHDFIVWKEIEIISFKN